MKTEDRLFEIGKTYQKIIEERVAPFPSGICYHCAASLHKYFAKLSMHSSVVVGDLALLNISDKFAVYGNKMNLIKQENVGIYHAWCEVEIDENIFIIDPSIKYNRVFLKNQFNFKTSKKVLDVIISKERNKYHYKYRRNDSLISIYEDFLNKIEKGKIDTSSISEELLRIHPNF